MLCRLEKTLWCLMCAGAASDSLEMLNFLGNLFELSYHYVLLIGELEVSSLGLEHLFAFENTKYRV